MQSLTLEWHLQLISKVSSSLNQDNQLNWEWWTTMKNEQWTKTTEFIVNKTNHISFSMPFQLLTGGKNKTKKKSFVVKLITRTNNSKALRLSVKRKYILIKQEQTFFFVCLFHVFCSSFLSSSCLKSLFYYLTPF